MPPKSNEAKATESLAKSVDSLTVAVKDAGRKFDKLSMRLQRLERLLSDAEMQMSQTEAQEEDEITIPDDVPAAHMPAYEEGRDARYAGVDIYATPYMSGTEPHLWWRRGWNDAAQAQRGS